MTSTLQGLFTEYDASFQHVSDLGDNRLSLIKDVRIHELIHSVLDTTVGADDLPDFLTNGIADPNDAPETIYFSSGGTAPVGMFEAVEVDGVPTIADRQVELTTSSATG